MENYDYKKYAWIAGTFALAGIFFAALAFGVSEWKLAKYPNGQTPSVTVFGEGEATAAPDIATVTFTVRESGKTVPEAQKLAEQKIKEAMTSLITLGVSQKDQRTVSYYVNQKYENVPVSSGMSAGIGYYPVTNTKLVGYEVTETVEVKVRNVDSAGDVLRVLGEANITEMNGPSFTLDNPEKVEAEAKEKAIAEAKDKALATAKALGASLGPVIQYNEDNGNNYPMYAKTMMADGRGGASTPEVTLPTGENTFRVRVTITYRLD